MTDKNTPKAMDDEEGNIPVEVSVNRTLAGIPPESMPSKTLDPSKFKPIATEPRYFGSGDAVQTQFPGLKHPAGPEKTARLCRTMEGILETEFAQDYPYAKVIERTMPGGQVPDFSIVLNGRFEELPKAIEMRLKEECHAKATRHADR